MPALDRDAAPTVDRGRRDKPGTNVSGEQRLAPAMSAAALLDARNHTATRVMRRLEAEGPGRGGNGMCSTVARAVEMVGRLSVRDRLASSRRKPVVRHIALVRKRMTSALICDTMRAAQR